MHAFSALRTATEIKTSLYLSKIYYWIIYHRIDRILKTCRWYEFATTTIQNQKMSHSLHSFNHIKSKFKSEWKIKPHSFLEAVPLLCFHPASFSPPLLGKALDDPRFLRQNRTLAGPGWEGSQLTASTY